MDLRPIDKNEVSLLEPLPWPLFDQEGKLLFIRGQIIGLEQWPQSGVVYHDISERAVEAEPEEKTPQPPVPERPPFDDDFPPRGIKPQIGEVVRLRRLQQDSTSHYEVKLIGYIKNRSILVSAPHLKGRTIDLSEGEALDVMMLVGRNIVQFSTQIERIAIAPTHYLHLKYPEGVRRQELRQSPWVRAHIAATAQNSSGETLPAFLDNLSASGAKFTAPRELGEEGDNISLSLPITIDEMKTTLKLGAQIKHVRELHEEDNSLREFGISFDNPRPEEIIWLKCLVYQRIAGGFLI